MFVRFALGALLLIAPALLAGCARKAPAPVVKPVAIKPPVVAQPPPAVTVKTPAAAPVEAAAEAIEAEPVAAVEAPLAAAPLPTFGAERILLLAPYNPLIIEFQFTIDGQPHGEALERLVGEAIKLADADGDGRPMWKELTASKRFKYGQFGNLAINSDNDHKQIVERYDIDRDGVVDSTELPRFLTRNAGGSRAFSIRGASDYRDLNRRGAPAWQLVDADDDGMLSQDELSSLASRLASRDMDDDEILVAADLNPSAAASAMPGMMAERRRRGPDASRMLGPHADWDSVRLALENRYSGSSYLQPDSFPLTPELFAQLDANADGKVRKEEFERLNEVEPHVVVAVEFGVAEETEDKEQESGDGSQESEEKVLEAAPAAPRVRLVRIADALTTAGQDAIEQPNRLTLRFGGMVLTLYTNDTIVNQDFEAQAQQALATLDANKDGYLEKSEVPETAQPQLGQFEAVDADEDGKVYAGEIVAFLTQQQAAQRSQIHAKASDREDVLFAVLDADHDERLDLRELESAPERMGVLDRDGDGLISPDELPEVMTIGLARGNLENMDALFVPPPVVARGPAGDAPRWFTSMDANADGAISQREFIGSEDKFAELDANGNGLLEAPEASKPASN